SLVTPEGHQLRVDAGVVLGGGWILLAQPELEGQIPGGYLVELDAHIGRHTGGLEIFDLDRQECGRRKLRRGCLRAAEAERMDAELDLGKIRMGGVAGAATTVELPTEG